MYMFPNEPYCYECHQKSCGNSCSKCLRFYCDMCASKDEITGQYQLSPPSIIEKCPQCIQLQLSHERWTNGVAFEPMSRHMIRCVFEKIFKKFAQIPKLLKEDESFFVGKICADHKPFTFITVARKIRNLSYRCSEELAIDLKTIQHILLASPRKNFDRRELTGALEYLEMVMGELKFANLCPYCPLNYEDKRPAFLRSYEKISPHFITPCPWPHALVLAKFEGFPPWPAKILQYNPKNKLVDVVFFGTYEWGTVDLQSVIHARDPSDHPNDYEKFRAEVPMDINFHLKFNIAVEELRAHIKQLRIDFPGQRRMTSEFRKPWLPTDNIYLFKLKTNREDEVGILIKKKLKRKKFSVKGRERRGISSHVDAIDLHHSIQEDEVYLRTRTKKSYETDSASYTSPENDCHLNSTDSHRDQNFHHELARFSSSELNVTDKCGFLSHKASSSLEKDEGKHLSKFIENPNGPTESPESLENGLSSCESDYSCVSPSPEIYVHPDNLLAKKSKNGKKDSKFSIEELKRKALDDGLRKNLRVKLEKIIIPLRPIFSASQATTNVSSNFPEIFPMSKSNHSSVASSHDDCESLSNTFGNSHRVLPNEDDGGLESSTNSFIDLISDDEVD
ncbi:uncharacterized protein LOC141849611 [Brevipalpus obovatus]|uniref:uncharacterized protein LOC141849611 n=1 Tax=Brevipalpus obovatus TaxID=246614 RepID=UPI003D9E4A0F